MSEQDFEIDDPLLEARTVAELTALLAEQPLRAGQVVEARVTAVDDDFVTLDVPDAGAGRIPTARFAALGESPAVDDEVRVYVDWLSPEGPRLSRQKAASLDLWSRLEEAAENLEPVTARVLAETREGYSVDVGFKAVLPANQLQVGGARGVELIGQSLEVYVLHADRRRMRLELSQRRPAAGPARRLHDVTDIFEQLEPGQNVVGRVDRMTDFGAFVDIGGFDGLLHVNDLTWGRVNHPSEVLRVGDELAVQVLDVDREKRRVSLGLKQLSPDPWSLAAERYPQGARVTGRVVSLANYGAFVEVEPGIEGLIHVSEMGWTRVNHPKQVVRKGQEVEAVVLRCEPHQRRLKLSLKPLIPNPWEAVRDRYPPGTVIRGKVRNVVDWGIFIGVEKGIDGLVHTSDLAWGNVVRHASDRYKKGQQVEAMVLEVDPERERMSLGIRQLTADPTRPFFEAHGPGDVVAGEVTGVTDFGAFVRLAPELEGLVHVSELSDGPVEHAGERVKVGQPVQVKILRIEPEVPKISLSMKGVPQPEVEAPEAGAPEKAAAEPAKAAAEPEKSTAEPEKAAAEPEKAAAEPEKSTAEPETAAEQPEKSAAEPEKAPAEPEKSTAEPETAAEQPENAAAEPEKPVVAPEEAAARPEQAAATSEESAEEPDKAAAEPPAPEEPDRSA